MFRVGLAFQIRSLAAVPPWPTCIVNDFGDNNLPTLVIF